MGTYGQCPFLGVNDTKFCPRHGGNMVSKSERPAEKVRNYNLTKYRARVNQFADNPEIKSLREEIGITRLQLETIVNRCTDDHELLIMSDRIQSMVSQIEKLVTSCHKLEEKTGVVLDKSQVVVLCDQIIRIMGQHLDTNTLDEVSCEILSIVEKLGTVDEKAAA